MWTRIIISIIFIALIDLLLIAEIRKVFRKGGASRKFLISLVWSSLFAFVLYTAYIFSTTGSPGIDPDKYRTYFNVTTLFILLYLPKIPLMIFFGISAMVLWISKKKKQLTLTYLLNTTGILLSVFLLLASLFGVFAGKTNFQSRNIAIYSEDIPGKFNSIRLVQFSDAHLGSFSKPEQAWAGFDLIMRAEPDIIVFTGDLINVAAEETYPYIDIMSALDAPLGKYAILGNHDMSDYATMDTLRPIEVNVKMLEEAFRKMGFTLLRNENKAVHFMGDSIFIAGVDNWGLPPFSQHGNIDMALEGIPGNAFTVLLSHDPSHWRAEILDRNIADLTLSGHTHGMQLGIRTESWAWCPSQWKYPEWVGLYEEGNQKLYVNPGFGYIGFKGRIGIYPEITVFELQKTLY